MTKVTKTSAMSTEVLAM